MKRLSPMTATDQVIVATQLAAIRKIMIGRVPDRVMKTFTRFVEMMALPPLHRQPCTMTPESPRLSAAEANVLLEWFLMIMLIFNDHVPAPVTDAALKLERELFALGHMPAQTEQWWRNSSRESQEARMT